MTLRDLLDAILAVGTIGYMFAGIVQANRENWAQAAFYMAFAATLGATL